MDNQKKEYQILNLLYEYGTELTFFRSFANGVKNNLVHKNLLQSSVYSNDYPSGGALAS